METLHRLKSLGLVLGIAFMALGIVFLIVPDRVAAFLAIFVGAVVTGIGIIRLVFIAYNWTIIAKRLPMLIIALLVSGVGIFMLFNPQITLTVVGAVIGFFAILMAVDRFVTANRYKGQANILPTVISGIIHLIFGVGMIYSALLVFSIIIVIVGIYLIIAGIMFILSTNFFKDF